MKSIIRFFAVAFFFLLLAAPSFAQRGDWGQNPEERAKQQTERMTEDLALSDKQAEKIGEINLKYANKFKETREAGQDDDRTAMRETMMKLRQEQRTEWQKILTTEQFEKWSNLQQERLENRKGPKSRRGKMKPRSESQNDQNR